MNVDLKRDIRKEYDLKFYLTVGTVIIFLVESLINIKVDLFTPDVLMLCLLALVASSVSTFLIDKVSGLKSFLNFALPIYLILALTKGTDLSEIVAAAAIIVSFLIPPRVLNIKNLFSELFSIYIGFMGLEIVRLLISLIPGRSAMLNIGVSALVFIFIYGYVKFWFESGLLRFKKNSYIRNSFSFYFSYLFSVFGSALYISAYISGSYFDFRILTILIPFLIGLLTWYGINKRNDLHRVVSLAGEIISKNDSESKAQKLAERYSRGIAYELGLKPKEIDNTIFAALLHDVGKAGMHKYSVDHLMETISTNKGEPLHSERSAEIFSNIKELEEVVNILAEHHRLSKDKASRKDRKSIWMMANTLTVATTFSERIALSAGQPITEREAFKSLKKDSGWELNPKVIRALREYLIKHGIKRI